MVEQVANTDEEQKVIELLHVAVGEYLAAGYTNGEILGHLRLDHKQTLEQAQEALRGVYDSWTSVRAKLNIEAEDDRNWHIHLRMQLLQTALKNLIVPSQRLALMVLDSLAGIQGISTIPEQAIPLRIELVEKKPELKEEEQKNGTG